MSRALDAYRATATEDQLMRAITDLVAWRRGVWAHVTDSRGMSVEGLPDLIVAVPEPLYGLRSGDQGAGAVVGMFELKRMLGRLRRSQEPWLDLIARPRITFVGGLIRPLRTEDAYGLDDVLQMLGGNQ